MISNSLTLNEEHHIPSQIVKAVLDCVPQLFLDSNVCGWFPVHLYTGQLPNSSGRLVELIVHIIYSIRVDLHSHQILLNFPHLTHRIGSHKVRRLVAVARQYSPFPFESFVGSNCRAWLPSCPLTIHITHVYHSSHWVFGTRSRNIGLG